MSRYLFIILCLLCCNATMLQAQAEPEPDPAQTFLQRGDGLMESNLFLAAADNYAKAFAIRSNDGAVALRAGEAFDQAGSMQAIAYYNKYLELSPQDEKALEITDRIAQLSCVQLLCRGAASLVKLRTYYHSRPGFAYQTPNTPINEFFSDSELVRSREMYGRLIEYYIQAARIWPDSFLPHSRLVEIGLYLGDEALVRGAAAYLQRNNMPFIFSANFFFGEDPPDCLAEEQEKNWSSNVTTLPEMHLLRRGMMLVDEDGVAFYDRKKAGWFVRDRQAVLHLLEDYRQSDYLLRVDGASISDIGHHIRENFWGDLYRWQLHMHTLKWYDVPQLMDFNTTDRSRTFIFAPLDGFHVESTELLRTRMLSLRKEEESKQVHYSRNWSQRLAMALKDYTSLSKVIKIDEKEKFHHEERWFTIWCEPDGLIPLPQSADDYENWFQNAEIRSIEELEAATIAFGKDLDDAIYARKFGRRSIVR
jgi:tetratricopeptide (TPR) repeat protein